MRLGSCILLLLTIMTDTVVASFYPVGTPGSPWTDADRLEWRNSRVIQRSYDAEVVSKIMSLKDRYNVVKYGALSQDKAKYPLYSVRTKNWDDSKPCVLITGGVHGYETSGVQGALLFLDKHAPNYEGSFNFFVAPCVSPWGYETIQRWNCQAVDPNRSFNPDGQVVQGRSFNPEAATEESSALIAHLKDDVGGCSFVCHLDLHETTDTDDTEFRPAKASRDGVKEPPNEQIPDGFYLVADTTKWDLAKGWFQSMMDSVRKVTHIAPADEENKLIGEDVVMDGVICIPARAQDLGLCMGVTDADYRTTTEVYPDSAAATPEICNRAQVACIEGALDYLLKHKIGTKTA